MRMRKFAVAGLVVLPLLLAACGGSSGGDTTGSGSKSGSKSAAAGGKVGVILPDAASSPRWEANDRPLLKAAFDSAGIESDIQNADGTPRSSARSATA